jgi:hypothetical protein
MAPGFFDRFMKPKPHIVESPRPPSIAHGAGLNIPEYKVKR